MGDYDLTRLGPLEFEQIAQALVAKHVGLDVKIYGAGPDGGREATVHRSVTLPGCPPWSGYTVVQVKMRARPQDPASNQRWLRNEIQKEVNAWTKKPKPRTPQPDNLLIVTNVVLSAVPGHGVDAIETLLADAREKLPLAGWAVWHYDHICRLLDDAPGIRTTFAGLITPGDVLTQLHQTLVGTAPDLGKVLRRHAGKELLSDQWVRLGQAGSTTNEKLRLGQVAVDLPARRPTDNGDDVCAADYVITTGDAVLRPSLLGSRVPHLVLVGGPGQGKTTLGQLTVQLYRIALLGDTSGLAPQVVEAGEAMRANLPHLGLRTPSSRRWPLRVELGRYADHLAGAQETSLLRYLAEEASARTDETITASQLRTWLGAWPWLLVLDGFDEVTSPHIREILVARISEFLLDAHEEDADLLIVATTRPRGYAGEFTPEHYEHLSLLDLEQPDALGYAERLADVRHDGDPEMHRQTMERLGEAADDELTARLMRTPLQVTIMSLLLEGRARVPRERYGLFSAYYSTIYEREAAKPGPLARLLDEYRKTVNALHERVGFSLQALAEIDGGADPAMPQAKLGDVVRERLVSEEFSADDVDDLSAKLLRAATERLVLIVPKNDHDVGFEVRSLQELMAARYLTTGHDQQILNRLRTLAPSSHWRNTWLLAAGHIAQQRDHLIDQLLAILDGPAESAELHIELSTGATLACDLLDDGFAAPSPRVERVLLDRAARLLFAAPDASTTQSADVLQRAANASTNASRVVRREARHAITADPPARVTAAIMLRRWARATGSDSALGATGRQLAHTLEAALGDLQASALRLHFLHIARPLDERDTRHHATLADYLASPEETPDTDSSEAAHHAYEQLRAELQRRPVDLVASDTDDNGAITVQTLLHIDHDVLDHALAQPPVAAAVLRSLLDLQPEHWAVSSAFRVLLRQWTEHRQVGHLLHPRP